jgi:hypothetical protein
MFKEDEMEFVPAYYATSGENVRVPFIVSLMMVNELKQAALPPAVIKSIDRTLSITGAEGVALANIRAFDCIEATVPRHINRVMKLAKAMLLFRCESPEIAEKLMTVMNKSYSLTLVKEQGETKHD